MDRLIKLPLILVYAEVTFYLSILVDHFLIHPNNSILMKYLEKSIIIFSFLGIIFTIVFLYSFFSNTLFKKQLKKSILISVLGILLPFIFLFFVLSQLH